MRVWRRWMAAWLLLLVAGCDRPATDLQLEQALLLPEPRQLPAFSLQQKAPQAFTPEALQGRWTLLFFGYTRCPDVCPTELFTLSTLIRKLEKEGEAEVPQVLFVSVDGARDRPEPLQEYVSYYHPDFIGVTGPSSEVDPLTRAAGVLYERVYYREGKQVVIAEGEAAEDMAYLINHSATIELLNPQGRLHAVFSTPHQVEVMARDLRTIQQAWKGR
jgi:protein SCO1/2